LLAEKSLLSEEEVLAKIGPSRRKNDENGAAWRSQDLFLRLQREAREARRVLWRYGRTW
jgi:hypothetical protein